MEAVSQEEGLRRTSRVKVIRTRSAASFEIGKNHESNECIDIRLFDWNPTRHRVLGRYSKVSCEA
jgi:hypothetical protein